MALKLKGSTSGFVGLDAPATAGNNTLILPENSGSAFQLFANDITAGVTTFTSVSVNRNGDLTVPGTISIGGTLTYEDVINIDSVGVITAREGIFIPDTKAIHIGNVSGGGDLQLTHDGNNSFIKDMGTGSLFIRASSFAIQSSSGENMIIAQPDHAVELNYNGSKKLNTEAGGVFITGVCSATSFAGDGSGLSGISVGITTEALVKTNGQTASLDLSKDDHKVTATGTVTIDVTGGTEAGSHTLRIVNSGIATVGFSTYFLFPSGGTPSLPTASGAISLISFTVHRAGAVGVSTQLISGASVNFS